MAVVAALTGFVGLYGARMARSTSDFLVASKTIGPRRNAAAISGEYLSAASFLGIAGLVLADGFDALWYPVGFTAGYLALLLFVAAPLRRSGAYTLPDFAEARLGSERLRKICTVFVVVIGWLYLVPQLQGAGLTVATVTGFPEWIGAAIVMLIVTFNIFTGWMHSITFVQAAQYWIKLTALALPMFVVLIHFTSEQPDFRHSLGAPAPPYFSKATDVHIDRDTVLQVAAPIRLQATGTVDGLAVKGQVMNLWSGDHRVAEGSDLQFPPGSRVPVIQGATVDNHDWLTPLTWGSHPLLATYSLILALLLGTMGLPHVLGRYYTNPDGRAARKTTMVVLGLLGIFYLFPVLSGLLARLYTPELLVNGKTDAAVLWLPHGVLSGWTADLFGGLVAAGAFAAFLATASGLVTSIAGVLATDVLPGRLRNFRGATVVAWSIPLAFALSVSALDLAQAVGLAFAVAASTFCPLLVLGIWWRGLTDVGAASGLVVGGGLALVAVLPAATGLLPAGWQAIAAQPALVTVPLAFLTMVVVSHLTKERAPEDVSRILLRLHAPDRLGLSEDRDIANNGMAAAALPRLRGGRHRR